MNPPDPSEAKTPIFDVPCLECGSLPVADWEEADIRVTCSNPQCSLSHIAVIYACWPTTLERAKNSLNL